MVEYILFIVIFFLLALHISNPLNLLTLLGGIAIRVGLGIPSSFIKLIFWLIYVGGVLVLVIFSSLSDINRHYNLSTLVFTLPFLFYNPVHSCYESSNLELAIVVVIIVLLILYLFLILKILRK